MDVVLVMFTQDGERRDFEVKALPATLGRSGVCDFQIPLTMISRKHCRLSVKGDRLFVRDLGSSNGTYVNNKRIQETELQRGDTLSVGPVVFTVVIDDRPTDIKMIKTILEPVRPKSKKKEEEGDQMLIDDSATMDALPDDEENPLAELEALAKQKKG